MKGRQDTGNAKGLDEQIRRTLCCRAGSIEVTSTDAERMKRSVHGKIEEEARMVKWSARKIMVVAAAVCVLGSVTALAAGKVVQVSSHSSHADDFTYDKLGDMETRLGFATKAPEVFSNGYRFSTGVPVEMAGKDEAGNEVAMGQSFSLNYKKQGQPDLFLSVEKTNLYEDAVRPDQVLVHNGTNLQYNKDNYRIVPPDYQVSAEEQEQMDAGELVVSYGSQEVENQVYQSLSWEDNKILYVMGTFDNSLTAEEMAQMAGEIIDNQ